MTYTRTQKKYQFFLIWLLPLLGAILVLAVMSSDTAKNTKSSSHENPKDDLYAGLYKSPDYSGNGNSD